MFLPGFQFNGQIEDQYTFLVTPIYLGSFNLLVIAYITHFMTNSFNIFEEETLHITDNQEAQLSPTKKYNMEQIRVNEGKGGSEANFSN